MDDHRRIPASEHSAHLLDVTRAAYLEQDFDAFSSVFIIPHKTSTFEGVFDVTSLADLKRIFDAMSAYYKNSNVIDLKRRVISAEYIDDVTIQTTCTSQYVYQGYVLSEETVLHSLMHNADGRWHIGDTTYATPIQSVSLALTGKQGGTGLVPQSVANPDDDTTIGIEHAIRLMQK